MRAFNALAIVGLFLCIEVAHADKPAPPVTYTELSADKGFVFVMISPEPLETELKWYNENHQRVVMAIRGVYQKTGLYKNDGAKKPRWTVDWYRDSVSVASDGIHLVRYGNWPELGWSNDNDHQEINTSALSQEAITILANGKIVQTYSIGELIDDPKQLSQSMSHFTWLAKARIVDDEKQLVVITEDHNLIILDLASGKILEKRKAK